MPWPSEPPKRIIVRMPNWLGDAVMASPVLADLRHTFKNTEIVAMCQGGTAHLFEHDPHIDEIFSFKRPNGWVHRKKHFEIIEQIRKGEYDVGILLTNSWSSAWWFWRGHVAYRIGYKDNYRSILLSQAVPYPEEKETQHLVTTYKMLLAPMGIPVSNTPPQLYLSPDEIEAANRMLANLNIDPQKHTVVGINPGAAYGTAKCWLPDRFEEVSRKLLEDPAVRILYFGDDAGAPVVEEICKNLPDEVVNLAGKTNIRELMSLIHACRAFLTNDSGPMHIAAALGTPLLALFGSTSDVKTGPNPKGKVIHKHVECSPCYKRVCPIDFRCMKRIEVEEVAKEMREIIEHGQ